jgi:hypothetical protein
MGRQTEGKTNRKEDKHKGRQAEKKVKKEDKQKRR